MFDTRTDGSPRNDQSGVETSNIKQHHTEIDLQADVLDDMQSQNMRLRAAIEAPRLSPCDAALSLLEADLLPDYQVKEMIRDISQLPDRDFIYDPQSISKAIDTIISQRVWFDAITLFPDGSIEEVEDASCDDHLSALPEILRVQKLSTTELFTCLVRRDENDSRWQNIRNEIKFHVDRAHDLRDNRAENQDNIVDPLATEASVAPDILAVPLELHHTLTRARDGKRDTAVTTLDQLEFPKYQRGQSDDITIVERDEAKSPYESDTWARPIEELRQTTKALDDEIERLKV